MVNTRVKAFTLIELLVVIAIIAILAAILFPVFAQVREKARQISCASNEKQLGLAFLQYAEDYDETLPLSNYVNAPPATGNGSWDFEVDPYVKGGVNPTQSVNGTTHKSVYTCPDFTGLDATNVTSPQFPTLPQPAGQPFKSYVTNLNIMGSLSVTTPTTDQFYKPSDTLAQLIAPASVVLLAEGRGNVLYTTGNDTSTDLNPTLFPIENYHDWGNYVSARARHNGGSNYLLADGHVKYFRAPSPNYQAGSNSTIPNVSSSGVVYSQAQFPNATAWFLENPNAE